MERIVTIEIAKALFQDDFIGIEEIKKSVNFLNTSYINIIPEIPYDYDTLEKCIGKYFLLLGVNRIINHKTVTINNLRTYFGVNPDKFEPCFYNQDWYLNESFINKPIETKWFLIKKEVFEDSRAVMPDLLNSKYHFPTAIQCAYAFFVIWYCQKRILWEYDFVWCKDVDHNGDRIYVAKYHDIDGINKNGFSIHRHLSLRQCYSSIDTI